MNKIWDEYSIITQTYNKVRNYLTGKVYSTDKIKLNFKNEEINILKSQVENLSNDISDIKSMMAQLLSNKKA